MKSKLSYQPSHWPRLAAPPRRSRPSHVSRLQQSLRMRAKRIAQAENGVYLPRNRRDVAQEGRFAAE